MKHKIRDTDFLYLSARLRSLENRLIDADKLEKLVACETAAEAFEKLCAYYGAEKSLDEAETLLSEQLAAAYDDVREMLRSAPSGVPDVTVPFRYVQDCQNLKAAIKAQSLGVSPSTMMLHGGTLSEEAVRNAVRDGDYSSFPQALAKAAPQAVALLAQTQDPQAVDFLLDKAVFTDRFAFSDASGVAFLSKIVRIQADKANIGVFLRCKKMNYTLADFADALLPEGYLPHDLLKECYVSGGEEKLFEKLFYTRYGDALDELPSAPTFSDVEKRLYDYYMEQVRLAKQVPFGAEVAVAYLCAKETEITNARIVLAGKTAHLSPDSIRERLRKSY